MYPNVFLPKGAGNESLTPTQHNPAPHDTVKKRDVMVFEGKADFSMAFNTPENRYDSSSKRLSYDERNMASPTKLCEKQSVQLSAPGDY